MRNKHLTRGFTLIELMIGMLLTTLFVSGLMQMLVHSRSNIRVVNNLSSLTENGRHSLDTLAKEVRRTGYLKSFYILPADDAFQSATNPFIATNDGETIKGLGDPTYKDQFVIRYQVNSLNELDPNLALSSCSRSLGRASGEDPTNIQDHIITLFFYVATDNHDIPILYCRGQRNNLSDPTMDVLSNAKPLISNVEAMRVLYSEEVDVAGVPKVAYRDQSQVSDWKNVKSIKISLILQSEDINVALKPITTSRFNGNFQHNMRNPDEKRLYRPFTTTISLRN